MDSLEYRILLLMKCFQRHDHNCRDEDCSSKQICQSFGLLIKYGKQLAKEEGINTTDKELIKRARNEYQDDDIQIDNDAKISEGEDGTWVQAWVFLGKK